MLRPGNVHRAEGWREILEPIVRRYQKRPMWLLFRGDAAFARPEVYEYQEQNGFLYAIQLPSSGVLDKEIEHLLKRPVEKPARKPIVWYHDIQFVSSFSFWPTTWGTSYAG